jgi:integrase/recombinase XerD
VSGVHLKITGDVEMQRQRRLIWLLWMWPERDRSDWIAAGAGTGDAGGDNPAARWSDRTIKKCHDGYGRYLSWLHRTDLLVEDEIVTERVTGDRVPDYVAFLKLSLSSASVGMMVGSLCSAAQALSPNTDWSWLRRRASRLKLRATPSRDKRNAIQHTVDLYRLGKHMMETAVQGKSARVRAAQRYQAGLVIALLAARPLRIRNYQTITIGESLRWDGRTYWLSFDAGDTKTGGPIDEPVPEDLIPYLEAFLRGWRPILARQANKFGGEPAHRRLWVDVRGNPMRESTLRVLIEWHTKKAYGTAVWPHLFRDALLTSLATDQPGLISISPTLLGHVSPATGQTHYNQARMLDASRRFSASVSDLREGFLSAEGGNSTS